MSMKIEQVHATHKTWHTRVIVGDKTFGLHKLANGSCKVYTPFEGTLVTDYTSEQEAMDFFKTQEPVQSEQ